MEGVSAGVHDPVWVWQRSQSGGLISAGRLIKKQTAHFGFRCARVWCCASIACLTLDRHGVVARPSHTAWWRPVRRAARAADACTAYAGRAAHAAILHRVGCRASRAALHMRRRRCNVGIFCSSSHARSSAAGSVAAACRSFVSAASLPRYALARPCHCPSAIALDAGEPSRQGPNRLMPNAPAARCGERPTGRRKTGYRKEDSPLTLAPF